MKSFMDSVDYGFRPGGGMVLTLLKRIAGGNQDLQEENS
jgi:hypothetical protein